MQCNEVTTYLHPMLDDQVDAPIRHQVEQHLAICRDCRTHYTELGLVVHKLSTIEWQKAPVNFTGNVMEQLKQQHLQKRNWQVPVMRWTGISAAAIFVFSLGVWWALPNHFSMSGANLSSGLIVNGNQVIVPKGQEHLGNIEIHNGDIVVEGKVRGDIVILNGQIYKQAGADISGKTEEINQSFQILGYYLDKIWATIKDALK